MTYEELIQQYLDLERLGDKAPKGAFDKVRSQLGEYFADMAVAEKYGGTASVEVLSRKNKVPIFDRVYELGEGRFVFAGPEEILVVEAKFGVQPKGWSISYDNFLVDPSGMKTRLRYAGQVEQLEARWIKYRIAEQGAAEGKALKAALKARNEAKEAVSKAIRELADLNTPTTRTGRPKKSSMSPEELKQKHAAKRKQLLERRKELEQAEADYKAAKASEVADQELGERLSQRLKKAADAGKLKVLEVRTLGLDIENGVVNGAHVEITDYTDDFNRQYKTGRRPTDATRVPARREAIDRLYVSRSKIRLDAAVKQAARDKSAQADLRGKELNNIRRAERILQGNLEDPDIESKYVFEGNGSVVAPHP